MLVNYLSDDEYTAAIIVLYEKLQRCDALTPDEQTNYNKAVKYVDKYTAGASQKKFSAGQRNGVKILYSVKENASDYFKAAASVTPISKLQNISSDFIREFLLQAAAATSGSQVTAQTTASPSELILPISQPKEQCNGSYVATSDLALLPTNSAGILEAQSPICNHGTRSPYTQAHFEDLAGAPSPEPLLPTQWEVSDTAPSIRFAMKGDIEGLKGLFKRGYASARDVSKSRRFSLVMWALYGGMWNYKTVQFLLDNGAFVDESSYNHVWDYGYRMKCSNTELNELRCITAKPYGDRDWVAEQQFPDIHQIIFGESSKLLIVELHENPGAVHVKDAMGRTALDWATARGQLCDMRLLIQYGSRLDTMDISGRTTVLHAVDSHNDNALRILLDAGANPNPIVPERHRRSSPLIAASFGGRKGMMKQLIYRQAKIDACNPEGRTALQAVASIDNVACADILLGAGANPVDISSNGYSAITTAIASNSHAVLQFFLKRCGNHLKELRIDQIILVFADTSTTGILRSAGLLHQTTRMKIAPGPTYDEKLGNILGHLGRQGRQ